MQRLLDNVEEESKKKRLELNSKKIDIMAIEGNNEYPHINIFINGNRLKQRDQFKCLGSLISSDRRNDTEIKSRIAQAKKEFSENEINTHK